MAPAKSDSTLRRVEGHALETSRSLVEGIVIMRKWSVAVDIPVMKRCEGPTCFTDQTGVSALVPNVKYSCGVSA